MGIRFWRIVPALFLTAIGLSLPQPLLSQTTPLKPLVAGGGECLMITMDILGDVYKPRTRGFSLEVRVDGETKAMKDLTEGSIQMAMMARDASAEELAFFQAKWGYAPTRVALAMDALVAVVHKDNPVKSLQSEQTNAIFTTDRGMGWPKDILTWGDAGVSAADWRDRPISIYTRAKDSSVKGLIMQFFYPSYHLRPARVVPDAMAMTEAIAADPGGICMANLVDVFASLRAIPIRIPGSSIAIAPSPETVSSGAYPWSRFLSVYVNKNPKTGMEPNLKAFLAFALSAEGQQLVQAVGQAPLGRDINALNTLKVTDTFTATPATLR